MYWVEVPQAGLYMLCGCPADSVKFLMKRGLIATRTKDEVTYETGPNALLLSDLLVQKGSFANLAEFPLLQMLYRQGMILPDHPNNTGAKPLLIGSRNQVESQMQYIFRGNYGLVSEEEMIRTGLPSEQAREAMRLKLRFAFGAIRPTDMLLDTLYVEDDPVEIRNGVFIQRRGLNVFEIKYGNERETVDLNLGLHEQYGLPFSLGFHNIKREYFSVIHSGEGDGWDSNRQCVSSVLVFQGKVYLIDAGPNFLHSLMALGISVNEIDGVFNTHSHDDHFAGLPTLMRTDHRIKYYATPLVRSAVMKKISALLSIDEESFYDYFDVHDLEFGVWNTIAGLEVMPIFSPHPVETNIFMFRALWNDGFHTYAHYEDIAAFEVLEKMVTDDESEPGISEEFLQQVKENYLIKADLKKIDIGGGLIHGNAEDFRDDESDKIMLTHTSRELTAEEKDIGSGAPFGTVDVLIPGFQNYVQQSALQFLKAYFPSVPDYELNVLLNNPVITFNPESIIVKKGLVHKEMYIIITGNVELIQTGTSVINMLSAGAFVGELSGLMGLPSNATYRAASFVQALQVSSSLYLEFVKRNKLYADIERLRENEEFIQGTWLFGEAISYPVQNTIAKGLEWRRYPEGQVFTTEGYSAIYMVKNGQLERCVEESVLETLSPGDFFGEETVLYGLPSLFSFRAASMVELCCIPGDLLLNVPMLRWKLYETFEKRKGSILDHHLADRPVFFWRSGYGINIKTIDMQHRLLFEKSNDLYTAVSSGAGPEVVDDTLDFLIKYTEFHFSDEEESMKEHKYPGFENHSQKHRALLSDVRELRKRLKTEGNVAGDQMLTLLKVWVIDHILTDDRKFGRYLNAKGVY